ncbi:hypothetical protein EXIGLDRAFT_736148 [Exidia glandulosa HHB12029]|uniref:Uncharacterized protein n=1 Tax=Exidia glandulosa HHB12029 TaxID=1314781 RepID=A0A165JIV5_EXIGL|nr:hypothetical protein EXIGLDRAFT_736148 [Exidia glandulosa HHB12029]
MSSGVRVRVTDERSTDTDPECQRIHRVYHARYNALLNARGFELANELMRLSKREADSVLGALTSSKSRCNHPFTPAQTSPRTTTPRSHANAP